MDARTAEIVIRYRRCLAATDNVPSDDAACAAIGEEIDQRLTDLGYEVSPPDDDDDAE